MKIELTIQNNNQKKLRRWRSFSYVIMPITPASADIILH